MEVKFKLNITAISRVDHVKKSINPSTPRINHGRLIRSRAKMFVEPKDFTEGRRRGRIR